MVRQGVFLGLLVLVCLAAVQGVRGDTWTRLIYENMTSATAPSPYVAWMLGNAGATGNPAYMTFDGKLAGAGGTGDTQWNGVAPPVYVAIDLGSGNATKVNGYNLSASCYNSTRYDVKSWTIMGSNDNSTWTHLDKQTNIVWTGCQTNFYNTNATTTYRYYKLQVDAFTQASNVGLLAEWTLLRNTTSPVVPAVTNMSVGVNDSRTGTMLNSFSWSYTTTNGSDSGPKSGYCGGYYCNITNYTGTITVTISNVSASLTYFDPYDSPKVYAYDGQTTYNYTFQTYQNSLHLNMTYLPNGSRITKFCANISNSSYSQASCTTSGDLTFYNVSGTTTILYYNASPNVFSASPYANITHVIGTFNSTLANYTNGTYTSLFNITAERLYSGTAISSFNVTNQLLTNSTTSGSAIIPGINNDNVQVRVNGNYSINLSCSGASYGNVISCDFPGFYDDLFKINATDALSGSVVNSFSIEARNTTLGGSLYNTSTTNGSAYVPTLQGYRYTFIISGSFATVNATTPANASTNYYQFSLLPSNSIFLYFYDVTTLASITQNVSVLFSNGTYNFTNSSLGGSMIVSALNPGTWSVTASSSGYQSASYSVTVGAGSTQTLDVYLLNTTFDTDTTFTIKDADTTSTITGANVTIQQQIDGSWVTIDQQTSDLFGTVLFSLSQGTQYQLIVNAAGYEAKQGTFFRTQDTYIVVMDPTTTSGFTTYANDFSYDTGPDYVNNSLTNFTLSTSSPGGVIQWQAVVISVNGSTYQYNLSGSPNGAGMNVTVNLSGFTNERITGYFYVKSVNFDDPMLVVRHWNLYASTPGNYTLSDFMSYYGDDDNGLGIIPRALLLTVAAVLLAFLVGYIFGTSAAVIVAAVVFMVGAYYDWLHWTVAMVVVAGLLGAVLIKGVGR